MGEYTKVQFYTEFNSQMDLAGYRFGALEFMASDPNLGSLPSGEPRRWTIRHFRKARGTDRQMSQYRALLEEHFNLFEPTIVVGSRSLSAIWIEGCKYGDLPSIEFTPVQTGLYLPEQVNADGTPSSGQTPVSASLGKATKRLKTLVRQSYMWSRFTEEEINLLDMEEVGVTLPHVEDFTGADVSDRVFDGLTVISGRLYDMMMDDIQTENAQVRAAHRTSRFGAARIVTCVGTIKGDVLVADKPLPDDADVLFHSVNLKPEFSILHDQIWIVMAPHVSNVGIWTDPMTMLNIGPWAFGMEYLKSEMTERLDEALSSLKSGEAPSWYFRQIPKLITHEEDEHGIADAVSEYQARVRKWFNAGLNLRMSPSLTQDVARGIRNQFDQSGRNPDQVRFFFRHGGRFPITTETVARLAGIIDDDIDIAFGEVYICPYTHNLVMADQTFSDVYENHGGWDLDDSLCVAFASDYSGAVKCIGYRQPNSLGEYATYDVHPESWLPCEETELRILDFGVRPPTLHEQKPVYSGLPSRKLVSHCSPAEYTVARALTEHFNTRKAQAVLGLYVNSASAFSAETGSVSIYQPASMETAVDTCAVGGPGIDIEALSNSAEAMSADLLQSENHVVDAVLVRRLHPKLRELAVPNLRGWYSRLFAMHAERLQYFDAHVKAHVTQLRANQRRVTTSPLVQGYLVRMGQILSVEKLRLQPRTFRQWGHFGDNVSLTLSECEDRWIVHMALLSYTGAFGDRYLVNGRLIDDYIESILVAKGVGRLARLLA